MKTWKWLVIILVVALIGVYYVLGMDTLNQRRQQATLASQAAEMTEVLANIPAAPADLDQQLKDAQASLAAAGNAFNGETNTTRIVDYVLRLAEESGIKVVPLSTRPWAAEQVINHGFSVFYLSVSATGNFQKFQGFIEQLESGEPANLAVKSLKVVRAAADASENITADLEIAVYSLVAAAK